MRIPFLVQEGRFRPVIRSAIEASSGKFPITVHFPVNGGYTGCIRVQIAKANPLEFQADWENRDWTRFPARIRAAATALRDTDHFGAFVITHQDATIQISEQSA